MLKRISFLFIICLMLSLISLNVGSLKLSFFNEQDFLVLYNLRLPRTLLCWLLGPLLALSGAILQNITKNPLSSPDILGINASSSLAGLITLVYFPNLPHPFLPFFTFFGGILAFGLIILLGKKMNSLNITLTGVAIHILFSSLTSMVVSINSLQMQVALSWLSGSLWGKSWDHVMLAVIPTSIILIISFIFSRYLNLHQFSDDIIKNLGGKPNFSRLLFFMLSVFCGSFAVGLIGPVGFISLLSPQVAKKWSGYDFKKLIPLASLLAISWLLAADILGRIILHPIEVPVGIIVSIIGVPCFFVVLTRNKRVTAR